MINKTSALENAETSAVGRALAFAGFSTDASIASADEVANAIINQGTPSTKQNDNVSQVNDKPPFDASQYDDIDWSVERENEITFGKHKGTAWKDIADGYLAWLASKQDGKNAHFADLEQTYRMVVDSSKKEEKDNSKDKLSSEAEELIEDLFSDS